MVIRSLNLETVCGITSKLPENELPEIAFAGKSKRRIKRNCYTIIGIF